MLSPVATTSHAQELTVESSVKPGELYTEFKDHSLAHLLRFAVFLIPVFGAAYKTVELIFASSNLRKIDEGASDQQIAREKVTRYVNKLQVSDLFFGLAAVVEVVATITLGLASTAILPFLCATVVVKTVILIMNKRGMFDGYIYAKENPRVLPNVKPKDSLGDVTKWDNIKAGCCFFAYCVPLIGVVLKKENSILAKAEYLNEKTSSLRREQLEKIQRIHNICFFVAKAVSLTIMLGLASLMMTHPVALIAFSITLITLSYFGGKVDMEEAYLEDYTEWRDQPRLCFKEPKKVEAPKQSYFFGSIFSSPKK